jgi:restriction system protein
MVFGKIFGKKETEEEIKERERRRLQNERCAKLREEIARDLEEERKRNQEELKRKQQELIRARDENAIRRQEWAKKMAEAKKQKQLEEEKRLAKIEEEERAFYTNLQQRFNTIGADMTWQKNGYGYSFTVIAPESIDIKRLLSLLKDDNYDLDCVCHIKDIDNYDLITIYPECDEWTISFEQDDEEKIFKKGNFEKQAENFLFCYLENRKIKFIENNLNNIITEGIDAIEELSIVGNTIEEKIYSALESSEYSIEFNKQIDCIKDNDMLIVDYELPNKSAFSTVKEYKYVASSKDISIKNYPESYIAKRYESVLYSITLRTIYEVFAIDTNNEIKAITFNAFVTSINPSTGITERKCIISIQVDKEKFSHINLSLVEPKACFKALKGVSAAKLINVSPVTPILRYNKNDKRFVESKDVEVNQGTNLAAMHWEDFEHLVRELFEMEFARNGGEVRVTQASRDGGVDAVVFDPDPLRGGKIVIQAKRYTNTVGVSAVRDLYGTVINEGANTGILITTSDYGHDSYEFAKDKPLKLLNGGHLLALLQKNGRKAHINIEEAKNITYNKNV